MIKSRKKYTWFGFGQEYFIYFYFIFVFFLCSPEARMFLTLPVKLKKRRRRKRDRKKIARNVEILKYTRIVFYKYTRNTIAVLFSSICCLSGYGYGYGYANKLEFRWLIRLCYRMQFLFGFHSRVYAVCVVYESKWGYHEHTCTITFSHFV